VGVVGDGTTPDVMSFEEFKSKAYFQTETNTWVVNGDELAETEADLRKAYDGYVVTSFHQQADAPPDLADDDSSDSLGTISQDVIVNVANQRLDRWPRAIANDLTYCVSRASFGSSYSQVVSALAAAASEWQTSGGRFRFVHVSSKDAACTSATTGVVFNVRQVTNQPFSARSFFPSTSRANRELLIDTKLFSSKTWTLLGVMRHELGHSLGLRHEHTRPEAGVCFENDNWVAVTSYDPGSVMHYPWCHGTQTSGPIISSKDRLGIAKLYPTQTFTARAVSATQVDLKWPVQPEIDVVGYMIRRNGVVIALLAGTQFSDRTVRHATSYTYNYLAFDIAGNRHHGAIQGYVTTP